jgi:DNA-binding SARP family transcriptional activator
LTSASPIALAAIDEQSANAALQTLSEVGSTWWRAWDHTRIDAVCRTVPAAAWPHFPDIPRWSGLAAFMAERADALEHFELAWQARSQSGEHEAGRALAHIALVICLIDSGAMDQLRVWQGRVDAVPPPANEDHADHFWLHLGQVARVALGAADSGIARLSAAWLNAHLRSTRTTWSADERLIAALVLIDYRFASQNFEQFDLLANAVEAPPHFDAASVLLRARWRLMHGYAHYQAGNHQLAEATWHSALQIAATGAATTVQTQTSLALVRLLLDRGRVDEAGAVIAAVRPQWGAGRSAQLIQLHQTRARVWLLQGQAARALATLQDALRMADEADLPASERASCHTDLAQAYIALDRPEDAADLLARLVDQHQGRDQAVYRCLHSLLAAWRNQIGHPAASRGALCEALALAQQTRYTMFFRLLPKLAASLCALALAWEVETAFVVEVIRSRSLPAPANADSNWPWPLWLRLFGGFEMRLDSQPQQGGGKTPHKPLELLRLLACARDLALSQAVVARALWPESDDEAGLHNLDIAIHRLRKLLVDASLLWVRDGRVGLDASRASSDLAQRRSLIEGLEALAMRRDRNGDVAVGIDGLTPLAAESRSLVSRILDLTRSELLPGAADAAWLVAQRQQVRQQTVRAAQAAATILERCPIDSDDPGERELLEAALRIEPLAEALVCRLMLAYQSQGLRGDGLRIFETYRRQLADRNALPDARSITLWRSLLGHA